MRLHGRSQHAAERGTEDGGSREMNRQTNPVEWASFLDELDDAREHLADFIQSLQDGGTLDEADLRVNLGHVYAQLNRAWHSRSHSGEITEELWPEFSRFPADLEPVG
jgi:hypothetical protein